MEVTLVALSQYIASELSEGEEEKSRRVTHWLSNALAGKGHISLLLIPIGPNQSHDCLTVRKQGLMG